MSTDESAAAVDTDRCQQETMAACSTQKLEDSPNTLQPPDGSDLPVTAIRDGLPEASDSSDSSSEEDEGGGSGGYVLLPQEAGEELQSDWPVEGGQPSDWTTGEVSRIPDLEGTESEGEQSPAVVGNERTETETASSGSLGATAPDPMEESER